MAFKKRKNYIELIPTVEQAYVIDLEKEKRKNQDKVDIDLLNNSKD